MISSLPDPCVIGHEGGGDRIPGNTKAAINHGIEQGADVIEVDVRMTADRHLIVYHGTLDRIVEVHGTPISDIPLSEWKRKYPESFLPDTYHDEAVMKLSSLLERKKNISFLLDIKNYHLPPDRTVELVEELVSVLDRQERTNHICIASFDHELLQELASHRPETNIGLIAGSHNAYLQKELDDFEPEIVLPHVRFAGEKIRKLTSRPYTAMIPWVINQPTIVNKVLDVGVDGIITDAPGRMIASVTRLQSRE